MSRHTVLTAFLVASVAFTGVPGAATGPVPTDEHVHIQGFAFNPGTVTVTPGSTVAWDNHDGFAHTVTATDGAWDSGDLPPGAAYSRVFDDPGTFTYVCVYHGGMEGTVIVEDEQPPGNEPPTVAVASPEDGAVVTGSVDVTGTAADADGTVASVEFAVGDGPFQPATGTTSWSFTVDTDPMPDGPLKLTVRSFDGEALSAPATLNLTVEHPTPTLAITAPAEGATVTGLVNVTGTAGVDDGSITRVEVAVNDGPFAPADGTSAWAFTLDTDALPDGPLTVKARAFDGRKLSAPATLNLTVQHPAPTVAITAPGDGETVTGSVDVAGSATATGRDVERVEVSVNGGGYEPAVGTESWSFTVDTDPMPDGPLTLTARAFDGRKLSALATVNLTVQHPTPTLAITAPEDGASVTGVVDVTGTAGVDDGSITRVEVAVNGGDYVPADGTSAWSFTVDTDPMPDGPLTLTARAFDGRKLSAPVTLALTVEHPPPTITVTAPADGAVVTGVVEVTGTAAVADRTIERVEVAVNGGAFTLADGTSAWSFPLDTDPLAEGPLTVTTRAFDGRKYSTPATLNLTVLHPQPTITITAPADGAVVTGLVNITGTAAVADGTVQRVQVAVNGGEWVDATGTSAWTFALDADLLPEGAYTVTARAFDGRKLSAPATVNLTVQHPRLPDLTVADVTAHRSALRQTVEARVANAGDGPARAFDVTFHYVYKDRLHAIGTVTVPALPAGDTVRVHVEWDTTLKIGSFPIIVRVDEADAVVERNEGNNAADGTAHVGAGVAPLDLTDP